MNIEDKREFLKLAMALEPECLYEDGELSNPEARIKEDLLLYCWNELENKVEQKVSQEEGLEFYKDIQEYDLKNQ